MTDSITAAIHRMRPKRYTTAEAAKRTGRSPDTLKRWRINGTFHPSSSRVFGNTLVYLYTEADLAKLAEVARTLRPGRKKGVSQPGRTVTAKGVKHASKTKAKRCPCDKAEHNSNINVEGRCGYCGSLDLR